MVFVTAGMGGGTGSGAAPVVAELAKQARYLVSTPRYLVITPRYLVITGGRRARQAGGHPTPTPNPHQARGVQQADNDDDEP